jgi:transposase
MRAYSLDLRQRIVQAVLDGQTQPAVADRFGVSLASVQRFVRLHKEQGNLAAKPLPGRKPAFNAEQRQELEALLQQHPDWTLQQLTDAWHAHSGIRVCLSAVHRTVQQKDYRYKKRVASPKNAP